MYSNLYVAYHICVTLLVNNALGCTSLSIWEAPNPRAFYFTNERESLWKQTIIALKPQFSGDSDFVSAAKLARREGIDFILDPLGAPIKPDLFEHIDGLRTCDKAFTVHTKK